MPEVGELVLDVLRRARLDHAAPLCVLASRHRHACVVVARAGIPELLDAHRAS